jgi:hypothetical protein
MKRLVNWLAPALLLLVLTACTTARIDWNSRVGSYTYDQAVLDMGPPERSEKLSDGTKVAEWLLSRGYARGTMTSLGGPYYYGWYPGVHYYTEQPSPDHLIRLTFSKEAVLQAWRKVLR